MGSHDMEWGILSPQDCAVTLLDTFDSANLACPSCFTENGHWYWAVEAQVSSWAEVHRPPMMQHNRRNVSSPSVLIHTALGGMSYIWFYHIQDLNLDGQGGIFIAAKILATAPARRGQALMGSAGHRCNAVKLAPAGKPLSF